MVRSPVHYASRVSSIVVLGSANMDLVVRQPRLPEPGETIFGSAYSAVPGGKGLNQAVAAARAGGSVAFLGAVVWAATSPFRSAIVPIAKAAPGLFEGAVERLAR